MSLKLFVISFAIVAAVAQNGEDKVEILTDRSFVRENGYDFEFKTSDGVSRKEQAQLITVGDHQGIGIQGSYSYPAPDGLTYEVTFTADDKGYKPQIRVLPTGSQ